MATETSLSHVFPLGSRLDERGRLEIGGCDTIELAKEFGTPAYVVAEEDLHARARAFVQAGTEAVHADLSVVFASKAFPCTAVLEAFAQEGLWCDVASAGELHLALNAGFAAQRIVVHGNAKSETELAMALERRVGLIVVDNFDELDRLERLTAAGAHGAENAHGESPGGAGPCDPGRARRDAREDLHRPGGLQVRLRGGRHPRGDRADRGHRRARRSPACTPTSARSCSTCSPSVARWRSSRSWIGDHPPGGFSVWDLGGGLGVAYTETQPRPPAIEEYVGTLIARGRAEHGMGAPGKRLLIEPGRALTANAGVTLYTRGERQAQRLDLGRGRRRDVRQPAPDALRRALRSPRRRPLRRRHARACSRASTASPAT